MSTRCGWTFVRSSRSNAMTRPRKWVSKAGGEFRMISGLWRLHLTWFPRKGIALVGWAKWEDGPIAHFGLPVFRGVQWMKKKVVKGQSEKSVHSAAMESVLFPPCTPSLPTLQQPVTRMAPPESPVGLL